MKIIKTETQNNGYVEVTALNGKEEEIHVFRNLYDYANWLEIQKYKRNSKLAFFGFLGFAVCLAFIAWVIAIYQFIILILT
jgi:hypothetical protein